MRQIVKDLFEQVNLEAAEAGTNRGNVPSTGPKAARHPSGMASERTQRRPERLLDLIYEAGLTRRNPVDDTFAYHDNRCMGAT